MVRGRRLPSDASKRAPNSVRGSVTRPIGRFESDASPMQRATIGVVHMRPMAKRTPVPELPKSRGVRGECRPLMPTPPMRHLPSSPFFTLAPKAAMALPVLSTSSASRSPSTTVSPLAMAPNMRARCDMDLSPGTRNVPFRPEADFEIVGWGRDDWDIGFSRTLFR